LRVLEGGSKLANLKASHLVYFFYSIVFPHHVEAIRGRARRDLGRCLVLLQICHAVRLSSS
jgi:hypothetical protein